MKPDREERRRLSEEQEAELRAERARAAANDHARVGRAERFGWSSAPNPTRPVPCRDCGAECQVSRFVDLIVEASRDYLARRGEPPLEDGELTRCDDCGRKFRQRRDERAAFEFDEARKIWRRATRPTDFELDWLERSGYRDWAVALRERWSSPPRAAKPKNPRQRRLGLDEDGGDGAG